jgi:hypothetical protein
LCHVFNVLFCMVFSNSISAMFKVLLNFLTLKTAFQRDLSN